MTTKGTTILTKLTPTITKGIVTNMTTKAIIMRVITMRHMKATIMKAMTIHTMATSMKPRLMPTIMMPMQATTTAIATMEAIPMKSSSLLKRQRQLV